jgi:hypothetical protein
MSPRAISLLSLVTRMSAETCESHLREADFGAVAGENTGIFHLTQSLRDCGRCQLDRAYKRGSLCDGDP